MFCAFEKDKAHKNTHVRISVFINEYLKVKENGVFSLWQLHLRRSFLCLSNANLYQPLLLILKNITALKTIQGQQHRCVAIQTYLIKKGLLFYKYFFNHHTNRLKKT